MSENKKRTVLLINPRFQIQFMLWMGGLAVAVLAAMQVAHLWFFHQLTSQAQAAGLPENHIFYQFIRDRQAEMNWISGITFLIILCLVIGIGLVLSHRIAGPLYRLKKHFDLVKESGVPAPVHFREGDYFQEVAQSYNQQFIEK